jgi:hypothetical protein
LLRRAMRAYCSHILDIKRKAEGLILCGFRAKIPSRGKLGALGRAHTGTGRFQLVVVECSR